ncbi:MAG TPA: helicase C-terminal domain-containing protein [Anaerolineae bacterium]|nr:helicase C-terminal domain-containing protein [Anaerolineae bacterium]
MSRILVSLDLETTGLDLYRDAIIEIGAVKFRGDEVLDTFVTYINPGRAIPPKITDLTGIADRDVANAPRLFDVLPRLTSFVRDLPVIAHNVSFDLGFLQKQRVLLDNLGIDTFELASMMIPHAGRYNLGSLAREVGITLPATHRALDDARVAQALYMKMFERACDIPVKILEEIVKHAQKIDWPPYIFFADALKASSRGAFSAGSIGAQLKAKGLAPKGQGPIFKPKTIEKPLRPQEEIEPLDTAAIAALLENDGAFEQTFPHFEHRPQQVQMLRAVSDAFNEDQHLLVEAGTGTGKSIAYLLPAIHWAVQNGRRVLISTNTINLQEQLAEKDVPDLQKILPFEFRAAVLKGRSHYLCPSRLQMMRRQGPANADELRVLTKVLLWLPSTVNGDGDELFIPNAAERAVWSRLSAESEGCTSEKCAAADCFFHRARQEAEAAHVLIVNHALLLADVAVANRALPEYDYLIIDEAHHLEDAATDQLSFSIGRAQLKRFLQEIGRLDRNKTDGMLADVVGRIRASTPQEVADKVDEFAIKIADGVDRAGVFAEDLFDQLIDFARQNVEGKSDYAQRVRITSGLRTQPAWSNIEIAWENLGAPLLAVADGLARLNGALRDMAEYDIPDYDEVTARVGSYARSLDETRRNMKAILTEPQATDIYWIEFEENRSGRGADRTLLNINSAPLHIGPLIQKHLWQAKKSVVLTSATLRTAKTFNFVRSRLSAEDMNELAVGSPFDYKASTLLYLVTDIPEPGQPGFQQTLDKGLISLTTAMEGRTMVLFTSYASLKATSKGITPALTQADIFVYEQGDGSSRRQLMENFKNAERAVLLGTRSFWEGVDVPGEALSCLALTRLPFAVPTDPIFAARSETFGETAFMDYSVPDAILKFRQGFGRLIRTKNDRGVVAVFDKRLLTKQYGQQFLQSLPDCTVRRGPYAELAKAAAAWMKLD